MSGIVKGVNVKAGLCKKVVVYVIYGIDEH